MPGLAFLHVRSSRVARAVACCVIVATLVCPTESAFGGGQPYLVKDINAARRADTPGYGVPPRFHPLLQTQMPVPSSSSRVLNWWSVRDVVVDDAEIMVNSADRRSFDE
jgi:hypothetical protein